MHAFSLPATHDISGAPRILSTALPLATTGADSVFLKIWYYALSTATYCPSLEFANVILYSCSIGRSMPTPSCKQQSRILRYFDIFVVLSKSQLPPYMPYYLPWPSSFPWAGRVFLSFRPTPFLFPLPSILPVMSRQAHFVYRISNLI